MKREGRAATRLSLLTSVAAIAAFSGAARAEEAPQPQTQSQTSTVQEVVVTAQKRKENLQKVPISVTVVNSEALEKANVSGFSDLSKFTPSMTMSAGDQPANSAIIIRGVGTFAYSIAAEPSVLVVVDDVAAGYQAQAFTDLVDIDRVEVLNGPQSTLYGKSASAGLVAVTTKAPSSTFTYAADVKFTNDNEQRTSFDVSGPLSDTVGFRLSGALHNWGGNVKNLATGETLDGDRSGSLRGKLQWKPTENFTATLIAHYNEDIANCCAQPVSFLSPGASLFGIAPLTPSVAMPGVKVGPDNTNVSLDTAPVAKAKDYGASLRLSYDMPGLNLLSITALNRYHLHDLTDWDTTAADVLYWFTPHTNTNPAGSQPASTPTRIDGGMFQGGQFDVRTLSQEFRLSSTKPGPFSWLVGFYYSNEDLVRNFGRGGIEGTTTTPGTGQVSVPVTDADIPPTAAFLDNTKAVGNWRGETKYQNYALFGQSSWTFLPRTTLVTGLRFNREDSSYLYNDYYRVIQFPLPNWAQSNTDDVITGKAALQYQFADNLMGFVSVSKGYKGVAYDLVTGLSATEAASFPVKPEKSWDYEVGVRSEWFDRHLLLNATIYDTEYDNFQIQTVLPNILNSFILANIPKARTQGVELQSVARVTPDLTFTAGYAFTDAYAVTYPAGQCYSGEQTQSCLTGLTTPPYVGVKGQSLAGATLPNAPKHKINLTGDYVIHLPQVPFYADLSGAYVWQSKINYAITRDPGTIQDAYGIMNANLSFIENGQKRYAVSFFVNNLFDQHYASNRSNVRGNWFGGSGPVEAYAQEIPRDYDRYYGIRLSIRN